MGCKSDPSMLIIIAALKAVDTQTATVEVFLTHVEFRDAFMVPLEMPWHE